MTARVLQFDPSAHRVVDALLPWYVNGTLESDELEYVRVHLDECAQCRLEVAWLRKLHAACLTADSALDGSSPLHNLRRHLETRPTKRRLATRFRQVWRRNDVWARWAVAGSLVVAMFAASVLHETDDPAPYRTLGASDTTVHASGSLVVVFDPAMMEATLRRILRESDARLVDGPTRANAYILDVPAARRQQAMLALRQEQAVLLVAQLGPENAP